MSVHTSSEHVDLDRVERRGPTSAPVLVFVHGFGGDRTMWDRIVPAFAADHHTVVYDHAGCGAAPATGYDAVRFAHLDAYVDDLVHLLDQLDLTEVTLVGYSIGAAIAIRASIAAPDRVARIALVGGSARYLDDEGYVGGFTRDDVAAVLEAIDDNFAAWSAAMAPSILATPGRPDLAAELEGRFQRTDAHVARAFARATFLADVREHLPAVPVPALVAHCADDAIVPDQAAAYLHEHLPRSTFVALDATGHCPWLTAPEEVVAALRGFLPAPPAAR